jgi:hypothetical protein
MSPENDYIVLRCRICGTPLVVLREGKPLSCTALTIGGTHLCHECAYRFCGVDLMPPVLAFSVGLSTTQITEN